MPSQGLWTEFNQIFRNFRKLKQHIFDEAAAAGRWMVDEDIRRRADALSILKMGLQLTSDSHKGQHFYAQ